MYSHRTAQPVPSGRRRCRRKTSSCKQTQRSPLEPHPVTAGSVYQSHGKGTGTAKTPINMVEVWAGVCQQHLHQTHKEQLFCFRDGRKHENPPAQRVIPNLPALADTQVKVNHRQPPSGLLGIRPANLVIM